MSHYRGNWANNRYFWHLGRFKFRVNYWLYSHTPLDIVGRSWETAKYDRGS